MREMEAVAVVLWCQHGIARCVGLGGKRWSVSFLCPTFARGLLCQCPVGRSTERQPRGRPVCWLVLHRGGDKSPVGAEMLVSIGLFNSGRGAKLFLDRLAALLWLA